ncbi:MAG: ferrochelatase [Thermoleophilia bacterium]
MDQSFVDIALLAFGGPESVAAVPQFLQRMTGRQPTADVLAKVEERYQIIGGGSPLPAITHRQAAALERLLLAQLHFPLRVRAGFLYGDPSVAVCLRELDGRKVLALPLSPFSSRLTTKAYREALDAAGAAAVPLLDGWHTDRRFVAAIAERITAALAAAGSASAADYAVLFTAHSVPVDGILAGDPYAQQIQQTIDLLVPLIQPGDWRLGWQSKGLRGGDWLEPSTNDMVQEFAAAGWRKLLVVPVGFVSDHVETLFDLDVELRRTATAAGLEFVRSRTPNDSPTFIAALAGFVTGYLARRPVAEFLAEAAAAGDVETAPE